MDTKSHSESGLIPGFREMTAMILPQMGLMLCHLGISMTDLWVAGRIDAAVVASMGIVSQIFMLLMLVASIAGSGTLSAVSQALGAGLAIRARRYAGLILVAGLLLGSAAALMGYLTMPLLFVLVKVPDALLPVVRVFVTVYCLNLPFYYTLIVLNSIFRAYKMVHLPFITFVLVFAANGIGSTGFGLGWWGLPSLGYSGVVWATFASTVMGLLCSLFAAFRKGILRRDSFARLRWNIAATPYLLRVGVPAAAGRLLEQGGRVAMLGFVTTLPGAVDLVAGMTLGMRIHAVLMFPMGAIGLTMAIFSGRLLGAGQGETLFRFGLRTACVNSLAFAVPAVALYCFRDAAATFLAPGETALVCHAARYLSFACLGVPAMAFALTLHGVFAGAGATPLGLVADVGTVWLVLIPATYVLGHILEWGGTGIFTGLLLADFVFAGIVGLIYCSRKWLFFGMRTRRQPVR